MKTTEEKIYVFAQGFFIAIGIVLIIAVLHSL